MHDFELFKNSVKEVSANVVEIRRELELELESKDVAVFLHSHVTLMNVELLVIDEQIKWFLDIESTPGEMLKMVEITTKHVEYNINLS